MRVVFIFYASKSHVCYIIMFSNKVIIGVCCLRVNNLSYRFIVYTYRYNNKIF